MQSSRLSRTAENHTELFCILYVESNDNEVFIHAANGCSYRTRTRISQWEKLLDDRFVRIHRAYLVNGSGDRLYGESGDDRRQRSSRIAQLSLVGCRPAGPDHPAGYRRCELQQGRCCCFLAPRGIPCDPIACMRNGPVRYLGPVPDGGIVPSFSLARCQAGIFSNGFGTVRQISHPGIDPPGESFSRGLYGGAPDRPGRDVCFCGSCRRRLFEQKVFPCGGGCARLRSRSGGFDRLRSSAERWAPLPADGFDKVPDRFRSAPAWNGVPASP